MSKCKYTITQIHKWKYTKHKYKWANANIQIHKYTNENTQKHNYTKHQHKLPNMQWNYCCIQTSFCYIYSVKCFNFPCILSGKTVWFFLEHLQTHILTVPRMIRITRELNIHCQGLDFWNKLFVVVDECKSAERRLQFSLEISEGLVSHISKTIAAGRKETRAWYVLEHYHGAPDWEHFLKNLNGSQRFHHQAWAEWSTRTFVERYQIVDIFVSSFIWKFCWQKVKVMYFPQVAKTSTLDDHLCPF